ncbi:LOW QUALITY PROTEIN: hypothetical protein HZS_2549 [Henneguya salminicola]|nr:LOW QUALITY PROTEIN: hypothetical protein HZS_2549 [Henneguya salminicola]
MNIIPTPCKTAIIKAFENGNFFVLHNFILAAFMLLLRHASNIIRFLRRYWPSDIHGKYHKILIRIPNEPIHLMRYSRSIFTVSTFIYVPAFLGSV